MGAGSGRAATHPVPVPLAGCVTLSNTFARLREIHEDLRSLVGANLEYYRHNVVARPESNSSAVKETLPFLGGAG
jgi:hypothetical protein